jgi:hypothetical protein
MSVEYPEHGQSLVTACYQSWWLKETLHAFAYTYFENMSPELPESYFRRLRQLEENAHESNRRCPDRL